MFLIVHDLDRAIAAKPCPAATIPNSDYAAAGALTGVHPERTLVRCQTDFSDHGVGAVGCDDGAWVSVTYDASGHPEPGRTLQWTMATTSPIVLVLNICNDCKQDCAVNPPQGVTQPYPYIYRHCTENHTAGNCERMHACNARTTQPALSVCVVVVSRVALQTYPVGQHCPSGSSHLLARPTCKLYIALHRGSGSSFTPCCTLSAPCPRWVRAPTIRGVSSHCCTVCSAAATVGASLNNACPSICLDDGWLDSTHQIGLYNKAVGGFGRSKCGRCTDISNRHASATVTCTTESNSQLVGECAIGYEKCDTDTADTCERTCR